jgi:hypothetical protein
MPSGRRVERSRNPVFLLRLFQTLIKHLPTLHLPRKTAGVFLCGIFDLQWPAVGFPMRLGILESELMYFFIKARLFSLPAKK